jgi:hypothetical protein
LEILKRCGSGDLCDVSLERLPIYLRFYVYSIGSINKASAGIEVDDLKVRFLNDERYVFILRE